MFLNTPLLLVSLLLVRTDSILETASLFSLFEHVPDTFKVQVRIQRGGRMHIKRLRKIIQILVKVLETALSDNLSRCYFCIFISTRQTENYLPLYMHESISSINKRNATRPGQITLQIIIDLQIMLDHPKPLEKGFFR